MNYYGLSVNPIAHSKSPLIHRLFAEESGLQLSYEPLLAPLDGFTEAVSEFFRNGSGANITVPFKEEAFALADQLSERAQRAKAVNTLKKLEDGRLLGDNTDGAGLVNVLLNNHVQLTDKKILILGAGGAVRGVLEPLLAHSPAELCIVNRTVERAEQLAREFADLGPMTACGYDWIDAPVD